MKIEKKLKKIMKINKVKGKILKLKRTQNLLKYTQNIKC